MYCGISKVPKGKRRGTAEECIKANQIRYYGLNELDPDLLKPKKKKKKTKDLQEEQQKLYILQQKAKKLVKEFSLIKIILDHPDSTDRQIKKANTALKNILPKRDKLLVKLKNQKKIVIALEKEKEEENKQKARKKKTIKKK